MEDKFKIILPALVIIAVFGLILVLFSNIYSDIRPDIIAGLDTVTVTNVTTQSTHNTGLPNNATNAITNSSAGGSVASGGTRTGRLIRNTPQLTCSRVIIYHNLSISGTRIMVLDGARPDYVCNTSVQGEGKLYLRLHGNATNGSRSYKFNVTYTAALFEGAWNVSMEQEQALGEAGSQSGTYYTLVILAVLLSLLLVYLGVKFGTGGFGGGGEGGGFDLSSITDKFER